VAKKPVKTPAKKLAPAKAAKAEAPAKQAAEVAPAKPKPVVPPRPVPAHQQFLDNSRGGGGVKPQAMSKARIIRHQGR
jgi:hypothetical protein